METPDSLVEEAKYRNEPKYRTYTTNIDKALRNFEYSAEWADLISALGKLSKAISSSPQYPTIPRKIKISKRLAQCMHPALPSGVHLKALETYAVIFSKTGSERLATELFIYSAGLFPLLGYAAMNVRPALLNIYENFFVPLGEKLRPALSGFLSGVLPGYENGLDHFDRTSSLLTKVRDAVNPFHFYTVLWECVATNASIRLPAITYILDHFDKRAGMEGQTYIMGYNRDVMMSGLSACLNDSVILVQRNTLEFLLLGFPMHTCFLNEFELTKLVTNGLNTILRRDMSLNRRLYSWLLGSEIQKNSATTYDTSSLDKNPVEEPTESYFEKHSKHIVIQALICTLKFSLESSPVDLKPYRIMISLLDKAEIGSAVLDFVLCDIIRTMSLSSNNVEVVKSANLLFATFDPAYIWSFMTSMYKKCCRKVEGSAGSTKAKTNANKSSKAPGSTEKFQCVVGSGEPSLVEICFLTEYLLETISLEMYNETTRIYLPKVFLSIAKMLTVHSANVSSAEIIASLKLCMKIVSRVQPMITSPIKVTPRPASHNFSSSDERTTSAPQQEQHLKQIEGSGPSMGNTNALEKSKSDSKLNATSSLIHADNIISALSISQHAASEEPINRSNSNQFMERKSPKRKKSKSYSKLSELDKEICPDTGEIIEPQQSSSDLDTPLSIKKLKSKAKNNIRIRSSPKKSRPKNIPILSEMKSPVADRPDAAQKTPQNLDGNEEQPKSAPANKDHFKEFLFDYQDLESLSPPDESSTEGFSILEKCIKQYEIFFEVYLSKAVLNIASKAPPAPASSKGNQKTADDSFENIGDVFKNEDIFEITNAEHSEHINSLFKTLCIKKLSRSSHLQCLLNRSMASTQTYAHDAATELSSDPDTSSDSSDAENSNDKGFDDTNQSIRRIIDLHLSDETRTAVKLSESLLVEMSTFPNCSRKNVSIDKIEKELPSWLKVLCIVASYSRSDVELQLSAITTLFDLISLLKSQIEHATSPGVTFVVMLPLLKFGHVSYLEQKTRIFQLLTSTLWNHLGEAGIDPAQITSLLYQLHNCLESGLVENIISNRLSRFYEEMHQQFTALDDYGGGTKNANSQIKGPRCTAHGSWALRNYKHDRIMDMNLVYLSPRHSKNELAIEQQLRESELKSFKKFELLWHLGRDKQPSRGFQKILLKIFDILELPYYVSIRTFVTNWLKSALLRGDISRLLKPLYKILLSPSSKRIGIVHMHTTATMASGKNAGVSVVLSIRSDKDDDNTAEDELLFNEGANERGVYAVSSEFGNIKYHHANNQVHKRRSPMRQFQKKIFGVALSSKNRTSNFVSDKSPSGISTTDTVQETSTVIGLIINPLDNSPDFDDELSTEEVLRNPQPEQPTQKEGVSVEESKPVAASLPIEVDNLDNRSDKTALDFETDETDSYDFDSESENRETSIEKDDSSLPSLRSAEKASVENAEASSTASLKRFAGDCESVTDVLTQHDRTKNRKTYRLSRERTPGDSSLASNFEADQLSSLNEIKEVSSGKVIETEGQGNESAHLAEEYFSAESVKMRKTTFSINERASKFSPKKKKNHRRSHSLTKKIKKHSTASSDHDGKLSKKAGTSEKKRMSCISKTSTDSNNSYTGSMSAEPQSLVDAQSTNSINSDDEVVRLRAQAGTPSSVSRTINVEDKRRNLTLETTEKHSDGKSEWELAAETIEKSKKNLQILRQNNAAEQSSALSTSKTNASSSQSDSNRQSSRSLDSQKSQVEKLHFYHNHMLIYLDVYDTKQALYAFQTIHNLIASDPRTFLCLSITTSLSSWSIRQLFIRHRKSIAGKGFSGSIANSEFAHNYRACMHLEALFTICLYYARGFFYEHMRKDPSTSNEAPTDDDVVGNCRIQLESIQLLTLMCLELIDIVKGMGTGLARYIADLMMRCKLQKVILHCLNSSVCVFDRGTSSANTLAGQIMQFNIPHDDNLHRESFQIELLRLLKAVIKLEYEVDSLKNELNTANANNKDDGNVSPTRFSDLASDATANTVKYLPNCPISQQPMFLAAVLSALQDERLRHLHRNWTDVITAVLTCFSAGSLTNIVISVVHQICNNIDRIVKVSLREQCGFPPDYVVSQLESLTTLCHYCLLDNTQQTTLSHLFNQAYPQTSVSAQNSNTGQLLNSIVQSFLSSTSTSSNPPNESITPKNPQLLPARNAVLSHLSRIVASVASVWDSELGQVRQVKQQLMEFLSPVSLHHGTNFLAALAVTWQERGEAHHQRELMSGKLENLSAAEIYNRNSTLHACPEQLSLINLVSAIRVMPMDSFVQTLHQVVKTPPPIHRPPKYLTLEVSALELFFFYMKSAPAPQLADSWSAILVLLRDGLGLTPPAQFVLLMLLNEFVQRCPQMPFQDKKDVRDLHDITSRLVDSLSNVAGSCLEQTTWLRRNLAVKEDISPTSSNGQRDSGFGTQQQYSVQAQSVLAAILANLLDVAYGSQEKDKVVSIVTTLLYNITPYLKNHTTRNVPSFYACSSLLSSLSVYQYTRKAWRKDMLDLMLDGAFFQMDISCLPFWKQIMDSLMTYDNTTFRELMNRVSLTQTGSLNIFSSREQEYEQRSQLLKRLAFVIFCSEFNIYNKYMPEIQEQLANSLRLFSMVPSVQAAVFLCFRVLLLRMSPDHVTSLWPIIIAEMVQVFLAMERELLSDTDDLSQQMRYVAGSDGSWTSSNGLNSLTNLANWRAVQLETSKLLELGCVLPATNLPHFQMYRWAFVGTEFDAHEETSVVNGISGGSTGMGGEGVDIAIATISVTSTYIPHTLRIKNLMDMKYTVHSPLQRNMKRAKHLMLTCQQIASLQDLYGFFSTLSVACPNPHNYADTDKEVALCLTEIEEVLSRDFLEKMSTSTTTPR